MRHDTANHGGFTLIEVLVSSTIAAMLITAVLGVAARLEQQRRTYQQRYQHHGRTELLRRKIQDDLTQCDTLAIGSNRIELTGPLSTAGDGTSTFQTATVRYVLDDNDRLSRYEQTADAGKRELLWVGVSEFMVTADQSRSPALPTALRLVFVDRQAREILRMTVLLRPGGPL